MTIKRITAIVPPHVLGELEGTLRALGVPGITIEPVQGYGRRPDYFSENMMSDHVRVVVFTSRETVASILDAIVECAQRCQAPTGLACVEEVERLVDLPSGREIHPHGG